MANPKGNPNFDQIRNRSTKRATEAREEAADRLALTTLRHLLDHVSSVGQLSTKTEMVGWLNSDGQFPAPRGGRWTLRSFHRLKKRVEALLGKSLNVAKIDRYMLKRGWA